MLGPRLDVLYNKKRFLDVFPVVVEELLDTLRAESMPEDIVEWYRRSLEYNLPGGKLNRGISVVDTVEILRGKQLEGEEYRKAAILGWSVELLQACFLVADDIMDRSIMRRGHPCWYHVEGVNNIAINDACMLESGLYQLLKRHFRQESYYTDLLELFLDTTYKTQMGELIDLVSAPEDRVDLSKFSLERHRLTIVYKKAYYSSYLPVALGMHFHGISSPEQFTLAQKILIPFGEYMQVQDDYLDCSAPPEMLGKIGTDIVGNKNTWVVNVALQHVTPAQRKILDENYGRKDSECEQRVKEVFAAVGVEAKYRAFERAAYEKIVGLVETIPEQGSELKREVFMAFLSKIFG
ncbi:hypothetical protein BS47DRAFT_1291730 [Hydnum rufescens UP504]|uniref:(2E,6E)-farnesyl diphosphate synthase n=1 Tax=Hydnum rufescens UP504 TaxID=1448309 RepID=A0A9P6DZQ3_9AGAM|nr:hypothetical protein BS47DRAFT_1291730 [Hydnum rufescens UP504]